MGPADSGLTYARIVIESLVSSQPLFGNSMKLSGRPRNLKAPSGWPSGPRVGKAPTIFPGRFLDGLMSREPYLDVSGKNAIAGGKTEKILQEEVDLD